MTTNLLVGDCRDILCTLADESVHCVVTSPPYWGLRDYGIPPSIWGGDPACEHEWGEAVIGRDHGSGNGKDNSSLSGGRATYDGIAKHAKAESAFCSCGAWRGAHGLEPTYHLYVEHAVLIFREVRRVLRKDGTLWLNLGDSIAQDGNRSQRALETGLRPKNLCGIPWRVAFALQADGWYLRQDIIWSKPNPMPESVRDRCTKAHEYIFLLSKSERYFYDADAIAENGIKEAGTISVKSWIYEPQSSDPKGGGMRVEGGLAGRLNQPTRNKRSVWEVASQPYADAHFATFPPALIEPCIKAGTSEKGCCAKCGAPWMREVDRTAMVIERSERTHDRGQTRSSGTMLERARSKFIGWSPSCSCDASVAPCTVLDPFFGAGTTGLVADRLQRNCIGIELNPDYAAMAEGRIRGDAPLFADIVQQTTEVPA